MVYENHNDGSCVKMTVKYMIDPGDGLDSEKIMYGDCIEDLYEWFLESYKDVYVFDLRFQDDSK